MFWSELLKPEEQLKIGEPTAAVVGWLGVQVAMRGDK